MNSAFYRSADYISARPRADDGGRVATTITLIAMAMCMVLTKSFAAQHQPAAQRGEVTAVRIVDPDFCKNQTWPYIDARCLKRVAPDMPVAENQPATLSGAAGPSAATGPSATGPGIIPASSQLTPAPTAPLAIVAVNGAPFNGSGSVSNTSETAGGAVQSTPPTPIMNGTAQNDYVQETIAPNTAAIADSRRNRRQHWQHGAFFGFRF